MRTTQHIEDLRAHFLDGEGGSPVTLEANFAEAIRVSDGWRNHAIFLYHASKNALGGKRYGMNTTASGNVIRQHIRAWTDKAMTIKGTPEPWVVPQTLAAFAMLEVRPPAKFVEMCQKVTEQHLGRYKKSEILEWISAAAELTLEYNPSFLKKICGRATFFAPDMKGHELYHLAHDLAILDAVATARGGEKPACIAQAYHSIFSHPKVREEIKRVEHSEEPRKRADAEFWFSRQNIKVAPEPTEDDSALEWRVAEKFKKAGARPVGPKTSGQCGHTLDLSYIFNDCNFDIEVDGPSHFVRSTSGHVLSYNGATIFQTLLIAARHTDTRILRLPYTIYDDHAEHPEVWKGLCQNISTSAVGSYMVTSEGEVTPNLLTRLNVSPTSAAMNAALHRRLSQP